MCEHRYLAVLFLLILGVFWTGNTEGVGTSIEEIVVVGTRMPPATSPDLSADEIMGRMAHARTLLEGASFNFVVEVNKKTKRKTLRGRPVIFAAQSARDQSWHLITIEMSIPAKKLVHGKSYSHFNVITPGYSAQHLRGTGVSLLMFRFFKGEEQLYVYGRKYPELDQGLLKRRAYQTLIERVKVNYHVPYTPDLHYDELIERGIKFLERSARQAFNELRTSEVSSFAYSDLLLADVIPLETIVALSLIEQIDDYFYQQNRKHAMEEVLNQYGLHGKDAFVNSVSSAGAIGPMQFTNRRGNGTYSLIVRKCKSAKLDPNFTKGAVNLVNAMKAAACLLDYELATLRKTNVHGEFRENSKVLSLFAVSAYNGGPDDPKRLYQWMRQQRISVSSLRGALIEQSSLPKGCPCVWYADGKKGITVSKRLPIPTRRNKFSRENLWYVDKYLFVLSALSGR